MVNVSGRYARDSSYRALNKLGTKGGTVCNIGEVNLGQHKK